MQLPPAVIIHGVEHARTVLAAGLPVTLLSAPGAGAYAGVGWWHAMLAAAKGSAAAPCVDILDCGDAAGRALEALRAGQQRLILRADAGVFADIAERAAAQGATLLAYPPLALDLATRGSARHLPVWLRDNALTSGR
jgi:hypothetical protein